MQYLIGEELNAVCFVMDYVELHFNGPILRALSHPTVETMTGVVHFPESGSRDAMCSLIGDQIRELVVVDNEHILIRFAQRGTVTIPLGCSLSGESAHLIPGRNQPIQVFV